MRAALQVPATTGLNRFKDRLRQPTQLRTAILRIRTSLIRRRMRMATHRALLVLPVPAVRPLCPTRPTATRRTLIRLDLMAIQLRHHTVCLHQAIHTRRSRCTERHRRTLPATCVRASTTTRTGEAEARLRSGFALSNRR
jgi:hypothetical protein